jgi:proteasome lid subunit RPN8/RPN11
MALRLDPDREARIRAHAEEAYPHECCGFLIGRPAGADREVTRVVRADNQRSDSPRNRYLISPEAYLRAETEAEKAGLEVIGFYHSHPDAGPHPSEFDRRHALPGCSYVIVAVEGGKAKDLRSWLLADDHGEFGGETIRSEGDPFPARGRPS